MRRDFITQAGIFIRFGIVLDLLVKQPHLLLQQIDLLLLPIHRAIELLEQILVETRLYFQLGQSVFHGKLFLVKMKCTVNGGQRQIAFRRKDHCGLIGPITTRRTIIPGNSSVIM